MMELGRVWPYEDDIDVRSTYDGFSCCCLGLKFHKFSSLALKHFLLIVIPGKC